MSPVNYSPQAVAHVRNGAQVGSAAQVVADVTVQAEWEPCAASSLRHALQAFEGAVAFGFPAVHDAAHSPAQFDPAGQPQLVSSSSPNTL